METNVNEPPAASVVIPAWIAALQIQLAIVYAGFQLSPVTWLVAQPAKHPAGHVYEFPFTRAGLIPEG